MLQWFDIDKDGGVTQFWVYFCNTFAGYPPKFDQPWSLAKVKQGLNVESEQSAAFSRGLILNFLSMLLLQNRKSLVENKCIAGENSQYSLKLTESSPILFTRQKDLHQTV